MGINWLINKKNSIFFQINLFFLIILIVINFIVVIQFIIENKSYNVLQTKRYFTVIKEIEKLKRDSFTNDEINDKISSFYVELATNITLDNLIQFAEKKIDKYDEPIEIFYYNNIKYVHPKPPRFKEKPLHLGPPPFFNNKDFFKPDDFILIDLLNEKEYKYFWIFVLVIIDSLLIWFFFFLRNKLKPLFILKENMIKLSKGELKISTKINGTDEIAQVANEFDNAIKQLRQLRESRNLFLRNIMHELKTPITKGKLISDTLEENERKYILIRVFQRLEYLLSEFSKIEELTSGKINLQKNEYRAIDLIEQALDILLLDDTKINIHHNANLVLNVDFDLFSIALKNLIDNSIKYNTNGNPEIFIEKKQIRIVNKGNRLKKDINEYYKPFNHDYETAESGLGLGLYISNNIIKIHDYDLEYKFESLFHTFSIKTN